MRKVGIEYVMLLLIGVMTLLTLITNPFEQTSPPDDPAYMQTTVHADFGDAVTLLGYTVDDTTVAPGDWATVLLYWRTQRPIPGDQYRPLVQIVDYRQTEAWAVSERFHIGVNPDETHTPDVFASDRHTMQVFDDIPPYSGWLTVQLIDNRTNEAVQLADGSDRLILTPVHISGDGPDVAQRLDYMIADAVRVRCVATMRDSDQLHVAVYWYVEAPITDQDIRVMMHGLDSTGEMITNEDRPPLDGDYPPADWQTGQTLHDHFVLDDASQINAIRLGMYTPDGKRLAVTDDAGNSVSDDAILLPADLPACTAD